MNNMVIGGFCDFLHKVRAPDFTDVLSGWLNMVHITYKLVISSAVFRLDDGFTGPF